MKISFILRRTLAACLLLVPLFADAQNSKQLYTPVLLSVDAKDGRYAKNEEVVVYGRLVEETGDKFKVSVMANGKVIEEFEEVELTSENKEIYRSSFSEATSVIVKAKPMSSEDKRFSTVGFVVGMEDFRPGFEAPADLMKYWEKELAAMRRCKAKAKLTPVNLEGRLAKYADNYECYAIEINMHEGNPSRGYIAYPKGAAAKSLPISLFVHFAGVNKVGNRASATKALENARRGNGAIGMDINAHGYLDAEPQSYYDDLYAGELKGYQARPLTTKKDFYFRLMYLRDIRALDYATKMKEWDGKRILVEGSSQGGGQSAALAGIDSRIGAAVITVPAMTDFGGRLAGHRGGWPGSVSARVVKKETADLAKEILPYFDGAMLLQHTNARLFIEAGLVDTTCPAECVISAFNTASSPEKYIYTYPYRCHSGMHKRYNEEWNNMIEKERKAFIAEYLK